MRAEVRHAAIIALCALCVSCAKSPDRPDDKPGPADPWAARRVRILAVIDEHKSLMQEMTSLEVQIKAGEVTERELPPVRRSLIERHRRLIGQVEELYEETKEAGLLVYPAVLKRAEEDLEFSAEIIDEADDFSELLNMHRLIAADLNVLLKAADDTP